MGLLLGTCMKMLRHAHKTCPLTGLYTRLHTFLYTCLYAFLYFCLYTFLHTGASPKDMSIHMLMRMPAHMPANLRACHHTCHHTFLYTEATVSLEESAPRESAPAKKPRLLSTNQARKTMTIWPMPIKTIMTTRQ